MKKLRNVFEGRRFLTYISHVFFVLTEYRESRIIRLAKAAGVSTSRYRDAMVQVTRSNRSNCAISNTRRVVCEVNKAIEFRNYRRRRLSRRNEELDRVVKSSCLDIVSWFRHTWLRYNVT